MRDYERRRSRSGGGPPNCKSQIEGCSDGCNANRYFMQCTGTGTADMREGRETTGMTGDTETGPTAGREIGIEGALIGKKLTNSGVGGEMRQTGTDGTPEMSSMTGGKRPACQTMLIET